MAVKQVMLTTGGFKCLNCGHEFDSPCMCGDSVNLWYGEFLFFAQDGSLVYWNSIDDPTYNAFEKIRDSILAERPDFPRYGIGMSLAILFDPPADGSIYQSNPYCPVCKHANTQAISLRSRAKNFTIPIVTRTKWHSLDESQQKQIIYNALEQASSRQPAKQRATRAQKADQSDSHTFNPPAKPEISETMSVIDRYFRIGAVISIFLLIGLLLLFLFYNP